MQAGLGKLAEAGETVETLSKEAAAQEDLLTEKQAQAEEALQKIAHSMEAVTGSKLEIENLKRALRDEEVDLQARKEKIEEELRKVQPQVEAARKAVGQIKADHLK